MNQDDVAGLSRLAAIGELAGPLAHEVNNFLNVLLLQVAALEAKLPEDLRAELEEIRRQGKHVTTLVREWQGYRRRQHATPYPVDVNRAVRRALQAFLRDMPSPAGGGVLVQTEWAPHLPPVMGTEADLERLCAFLLADAAGVAALVGGGITVRTEEGDGKVCLRVDDPGPAVAPGQLPLLFEAGTVTREGSSALGRAACQAIVRRFQGTIQARNREEGGLALIVELPAASP